MNPTTNNLLLTAIIPIIQSTVPNVITPIGTDDHQELVQDCIVSACQMADSMEKAGKEILPNSIAYYSIQRCKSGRRSYSGKRKCPLSAGAILDSNSGVLSLDTLQSDGSIETEALSLGDLLAYNCDDPGMSVARKLDWIAFEKKLKPKHRKLLKGLSRGERPKQIAEKLKISPARVTQLKKDLATEIKEYMGSDIIWESSRPSIWQRDLQMRREQIAAKASC